MKEAMRKVNRCGAWSRLVPVPCRLREGGHVDSLQDEMKQNKKHHQLPLAYRDQML